MEKLARPRKMRLTFFVWGWTRPGGIVISRRDGVRSGWDGVRLEGHGGDGKAREMEKQGRVVGMEDSGREKKAPTWTQSKKVKKTRGK